MSFQKNLFLTQSLFCGILVFLLLDRWKWVVARPIAREGRASACQLRSKAVIFVCRLVTVSPSSSLVRNQNCCFTIPVTWRHHDLLNILSCSLISLQPVFRMWLLKSVINMFSVSLSLWSGIYDVSVNNFHCRTDISWFTQHICSMEAWGNAETS